MKGKAIAKIENGYLKRVAEDFNEIDIGIRGQDVEADIENIGRFSAKDGTIVVRAKRSPFREDLREQWK